MGHKRTHAPQKSRLRPTLTFRRPPHISLKLVSVQMTLRIVVRRAIPRGDLPSGKQTVEFGFLFDHALAQWHRFGLHGFEQSLGPLPLIGAQSERIRVPQDVGGAGIPVEFRGQPCKALECEGDRRAGLRRLAYFGGWAKHDCPIQDRRAATVLPRCRCFKAMSPSLEAAADVNPA
jgi:hypothetical protein